MNRRRVLAPAKINLGLEILGKREDGFHEIRSILCTVDLVDELTFRESDGTDELHMAGAPPDLSVDENLVLTALSTMRAAGAAIPPQRITLAKRIPAAAGLGGASSDAAATLRAFADELRNASVDPIHLAAQIGSDVPFFLGGPIARVSGRGEILDGLPEPSEGWVVLAVPPISIPNKTATMYGAIDPAWWSDGHHIEETARQLPELPVEAPFNVFEVALARLYPEIEAFRTSLTESGFTFVALTGAGPTFYTIVAAEDDAAAISEQASSKGIETFMTRLCPEIADGFPI